MIDDSQRAIAAFRLACTSNQGVQTLLATHPSSHDLAQAMKKYAFRQIMSFSPEAHQFMLTLLDTIDWILLAEKVLANNLLVMQSEQQLVIPLIAA